MKKIAAVLLAAALMTATAVPAFAANTTASTTSASVSDSEYSYMPGYSIRVDGKDTKTKIAVVVPLEATAKALGFTVKWDGNTALLDSGSMHSYLTLGEDSYQAVTSIEGAMGATGPISLGAAPYKDGNTVYVPLELFTILMGNQQDGLTMKDDTLIFKKDSAKDVSETLLTGANVNTDDKLEGGVSAIDSFADYDRQSDAETKSGVTVTLPDAIAGYKTGVYRASESLSMIEVVYARTSGTGQIRIRKAVGNNDISGDYNIYSETSSEAINSHAVTLKGNNGKVNLATWTADGFTYAISSDEGLTLAQMSNLVRAVK